ncbi:MAG: hypothetical protein Q8L66_11630 [Caulobacter sp.]|nr:hypothetical protein [Caulobacter sp.]
MTAEHRLSAFLEEARGPRQDLAFTAMVMRRVARRELLARLLAHGLIAAAAAVALWASAPALGAAIEPLARSLLPVAATLVLTATVALVSGGLLAGRGGNDGRYEDFI